VLPDGAREVPAVGELLRGGQAEQRRAGEVQMTCSVPPLLAVLSARSRVHEVDLERAEEESVRHPTGDNREICGHS
jgi:hypothetical protein